MKKFSDEIIRFFQSQGCVIVSTIDRHGFPHSSCKGIVQINADGRIFLLDVYRAKTQDNLKANPHVSITAVDEHKFRGYCLKGKAEMFSDAQLTEEILKSWETRLTSRVTHRLLKNLKEEKGHPRHPELSLPKPKYLIVVEVEEVVDLTPAHLKEKGK
ncbi:MAG: pyridoxamine 5'-phosphate oxidase family protein [Candidatus Omnitrophica bacterium]|nr:pyridoxamine 5'-phosphate oxidase family protein [Candidatus Omnitrophota bacterium]